MIYSCSRPVSYLARTPPMPTRLRDSLNSIEDDTDSRLSLSLINPTFLEDSTQYKHKSSLEDLLMPIQPSLDSKSPKTPDKDSLDFELSLRSEITDIPIQTSPTTSPFSVDSERVRSALDFFEQSLQMDSDYELTGSGEVDLDTIVSCEKGKLEFPTKSRAPRPKGRRPQPRVRTKFRNEPIPEDIFLDIVHTAVAGLEDNSCQMQIKQLPPSINDIKSSKLHFRKSMSADSSSGPVTVLKPRNKTNPPRPLTEPNLIGPDVPVENKVPIIPPEKPTAVEKPETKPVKPLRNVSFPSRPVPPIRKKPTPSTHEPTQISTPPSKPSSKSCSTPITDKTSDEESEKHNEEEMTTKSISTPQPRERTPNSAMASVMITALTRVQTDKKDVPPSPPPVPPLKPPLMRDAPSIPSKTHLTPPQRPPGLHPSIEHIKLPPQRPKSPPKGLVQDLPSKPVPPPRIRKDNSDKKKERDSIVVID